jgi:hypothetical protein
MIKKIKFLLYVILIILVPSDSFCLEFKDLKINSNLSYIEDKLEKSSHFESYGFGTWFRVNEQLSVGDWHGRAMIFSSDDVKISEIYFFGSLLLSGSTEQVNLFNKVLNDKFGVPILDSFKWTDHKCALHELVFNAPDDLVIRIKETIAIKENMAYMLMIMRKKNFDNHIENLMKKSDENKKKHDYEHIKNSF